MDWRVDGRKMSVESSMDSSRHQQHPSHAVEVHLTPEALSRARPGERSLRVPFSAFGRDWALTVFLAGDCPDASGYVSLYLELLPPSEASALSVSWKVDVATLDGTPAHCVLPVLPLTVSVFDGLCQSWGRSKALSHRHLSRFIEATAGAPIVLRVKMQFLSACETPFPAEPPTAAASGGAAGAAAGVSQHQQTQLHAAGGLPSGGASAGFAGAAGSSPLAAGSRFLPQLPPPPRQPLLSQYPHNASTPMQKQRQRRHADGAPTCPLQRPDSLLSLVDLPVRSMSVSPPLGSEQHNSRMQEEEQSGGFGGCWWGWSSGAPAASASAQGPACFAQPAPRARGYAAAAAWPLFVPGNSSTAAAAAAAAAAEETVDEDSDMASAPALGEPSCGGGSEGAVVPSGKPSRVRRREEDDDGGNDGGRTWEGAWPLLQQQQGDHQSCVLPQGVGHGPWGAAGGGCSWIATCANTAAAAAGGVEEHWRREQQQIAKRFRRNGSGNCPEAG